MARRPDVQYIQMYNYGSTARKLEQRPWSQKEKYRLPEQVQRSQPVQRPVFDLLSLCAIAVAAAMLLTMVIGMLKVGELNSRRRNLEERIEVLQEQQADLKKTYEATWDLDKAGERARQMGMISTEEARHISMGKPEPIAAPEPSVAERFQAFWNELFAKAHQ